MRLICLGNNTMGTNGTQQLEMHPIWIPTTVNLNIKEVSKQGFTFYNSSKHKMICLGAFMNLNEGDSFMDMSSLFQIYIFCFMNLCLDTITYKEIAL